jgi:hypothetical protein
MGLAGKKQDLLGETVLAVGTFDLLHLPAQIKKKVKILIDCSNMKLKTKFNK